MDNSFATLPNGHIVLILLIDFVHLSSRVVLDNVLFVPQFPFNIPSISALIQRNNYSVNFFFFFASCVI